MQIHSFDKFHRVEGQRFRFTDSDQPNDVRVFESDECLDFRFKAAMEPRFTGQFFGDDLHGNAFVVLFMDRLVDDTHAPATEESNYSVWPYEFRQRTQHSLFPFGSSAGSEVTDDPGDFLRTE